MHRYQLTETIRFTQLCKPLNLLTLSLQETNAPQPRRRSITGSDPPSAAR